MSNIFVNDRGFHVDPRTDRLVPAPYSAPRTITASAMRVSVRTKSEVEALNKKRSDLDWQSRAWDYYDMVGEIKHAALLLGSIMSRIKVYSAYVTNEENPPASLATVSDMSEAVKKDAYAATALLGSGPGGIPSLLRDAAMNIFIAGEFYLVQHRANPEFHTPEQWQVHSVSEVVVPRKGSKDPVYVKPYKDAPRVEWEPIHKSAFVARIWRRHPRFTIQADSSLLGILENLDELLLLGKASRATIKSRLNNGILILPDTFQQAYGTEDDEDDSPEDQSDFAEDLGVTLIAPISDESSPSAVVPTIVTGPANDIEKVRHIRISRDFDEKHVEQAKNVLDRILSSLDIPKESISGVGSAKYSNAAVIEDSLVKNYIEPLILMICDSLTTVFLRPVLRSMGHLESDISRIVMWYDPSAITAKPSRADAADRGFDRGILSAQAWRRSHGFGAGDAPTELEVAQKMAVARGALSEPVTEALLRTLIPSILEQINRAQQNQAGDVGEILDQLEIPAPGETPQEQAPDTDTDTDTDTAPGLIEPGETTDNPQTGLMEP